MSKKDVKQRPIQVDANFHDELNKLSKSMGRQMKWMTENALAETYPALKKFIK
jgi:hypothetical protein